MNAQAMEARIAEALRAAFASSFGSMTGKEVRVSVEQGAAGAELADVLIWEQSVSTSGKPCLWMCAGRDLWTAAGQMTLAAVGIESVTDEDCRSTWQEIVSQTIGLFCSSVSAAMGQELTAGSGAESSHAPENAHWIALTVSEAGGGVWRLRVGWSEALPPLCCSKESPKTTQPAADSTFSKTFDLLMDVPLPVSVSFGRTSLELREVLKLNTGSVVELNRFVAEPVEVIVNDCVIARGEVVVVDGNYGVRITQLSSREDRLKFGMAETSSRFGTPLR